MSTPHASPPSAIDCHTAVRRLWDFLDHELDPSRFAEVEEHLHTCAACREHVQFAQTFLREVKRNADADGDGAATTSLRERILAQLASEGYTRA